MIDRNLSHTCREWESLTFSFSLSKHEENCGEFTSIASCIERFCLNISLESLYDASECQCCHNLQKYQPSDTLNRCPLKIVQSFLRTGDVILKKTFYMNNLRWKFLEHHCLYIYYLTILVLFHVCNQRN